MRIDLSTAELIRELVSEIDEISGQDILKCYQCGRCSAGCPMSDEIDLLPNQISRLVQMGLGDEAMASDTIWMCVSCYMCLARCPKGVDLPALMEALRFLVTKKGLDHFGPNEIDRKKIKGMPQQAIVSAYRKQSS